MARPSYVVEDGYSSVDQGGYFDKVRSRGSHVVKCDLDGLHNFWTAPTQVSAFVVPTDEQGASYLFCSNGHYSPRLAFRKDKSRPSGRDHYCSQCRHEQYQLNKATANSANRVS